MNDSLKVCRLWELGGGGRWFYLAGVLLLVDDRERVLGRLSLGLSHSALHLGALGADHVVGLALSLRHCLLELRHGLSLHLVHSLF